MFYNTRVLKNWLCHQPLLPNDDYAKIINYAIMLKFVLHAVITYQSCFLINFCKMIALINFITVLFKSHISDKC